MAENTCPMKETLDETNDETPTRFYMDNQNIKWRYGSKPDYKPSDEKYMAERSKYHKADSLEKLVENIVKTWEMEATHKVDVEDWGTIDPESYEFVVNGEKRYNFKEMQTLGTYNALLAQCPMYSASEKDFDSSHKLFRSCFNTGFAFELLELFSGPPRIAFTWRHWSHFTGQYEKTPPTGQLIELFGSAFVTVNSENKIKKLEIYSDATSMLMALSGQVLQPVN